jgi:hypothetical protein
MFNLYKIVNAVCIIVPFAQISKKILDLKDQKTITAFNRQSITRTYRKLDEATLQPYISLHLFLFQFNTIHSSMFIAAKTSLSFL